MQRSNIEFSVEIYRKLEAPLVQRGRISGKIAADLLQNYCEQLEAAELLISANKEKSTIEFKAPSKSDEFFAASMDDLLKADSRKREVPKFFYVADIDYLHTPESNKTPEIVQAYLDAVDLYRTLRDVANHGKEADSKKLIFFHKEVVEISIHYTNENLKALPGLAEFKEKFIDDYIHKEQKTTIIKAVLLELSKEFEGELELKTIIEHFEEFTRRVSSGYQLYVSEFSFQKVKAEVEKSKFEFITKMNKVFSDIQNQLLTVPAALIIAGSQFESADHVTLKNFIILMGALAFTGFMILLIINQRNTLKSLANEIDNEWKLIKSKHEAIKIQFNEQYNSLATRYKYQYSLLEFVCLIVVAASMATVILCLYFSSRETVPVESVITFGFVLAAYIACRAIVLFKVLVYDRLEDQ